MDSEIIAVSAAAEDDNDEGRRQAVEGIYDKMQALKIVAVQEK